MDGGVVVEQGAPREVIGNPRHQRTKNFLARMRADVEHQAEAAAALAEENAKAVGADEP
jgi:polar amino acid transport system ATP-binding protein